VSSGVEHSSGNKSPQQIEKFVAAARAAALETA
jgi:phosphoribosylanthranilate isomerase